MLEHPAIHLLHSTSCVFNFQWLLCEWMTFWIFWGTVLMILERYMWCKYVTWGLNCFSSCFAQLNGFILPIFLSLMSMAKINQDFDGMVVSFSQTQTCLENMGISECIYDFLTWSDYYTHLTQGHNGVPSLWLQVLYGLNTMPQCWP